MNIEQAFVALKSAGLHVRRMDGPEIIGGSHVDASNALIRMVENGFAITSEGNTYSVRIIQTPAVTGLSLSAAVELVLERVKPQPDIEAAPRPPANGTVMY